MAEIFKWEGTYDDTTADSGETIAGNGLSAGGGDGGEDTTDFDANSDYMSITGLAASSGILQQSSDDVLDFNQGTILLRLFFDSNAVDSQHLFGYYTGAAVDYFYITYVNVGSPRLYFRIQDESSHQINSYLLWEPTDSTFYDIRITWDMSVDDSIKISLDGGSWNITSIAGNESDIVISELLTTALYIGARSTTGSVYEGEISRVLISDVYEDINLGEDGDEGNPWYYYAQQ